MAANKSKINIRDEYHPLHFAIILHYSVQTRDTDRKQYHSLTSRVIKRWFIPGAMWMYGGGYQHGQMQQLLHTLHATDTPPGSEYGGHYHILSTSEVDRYSETYLQENAGIGE